MSKLKGNISGPKFCPGVAPFTQNTKNTDDEPSTQTEISSHDVKSSMKISVENDVLNQGFASNLPKDTQSKPRRKRGGGGGGPTSPSPNDGGGSSSQNDGGQTAQGQSTQGSGQSSTTLAGNDIFLFLL